jgi:hypothetical protein
LITSYTLNLGLGAEDLTITPTAAETETSILVNESAVESGIPSAPVLLDLGPNSIEIEVLTASGSTTYTIDVSRGAGILPQAYVKASNTGAGDRFGSTIALSGDTLAVGAEREASSDTGINGSQTDDSAENAGVVYVFVRNGSRWMQQAYIKGSNTEAGDLFGTSVTLSGDTLAVGARGEDSSATGENGDETDNSADGSGAVYVFVRDGTSWSQQAYIKASNTGSDDLFGQSVALSGDTLAVGADGERSSATGVNGDQAANNAIRAGAVYVFTRSGETWSQQAYIKASNTESNEHFGTNIALSGDLLAVGVPKEDSSATGINGNQADNTALGSGAVYVFGRTGQVWSQEAYIKSSNSQSNDQFGHSVAVSGQTLAVGALKEGSSASGVDSDQTDNGEPGAGAAYVFTRSGGLWSQEAYIKTSSTHRMQLGSGIGLDGDTLVVGANFERSNATGVNGNSADRSLGAAGAAFLFIRRDGAWTQQAYLKASNTDAGDRFGERVAISGDTIAAGAILEDSGATGIDGDGGNNAETAGAVYVFQ